MDKKLLFKILKQFNDSALTNSSKEITVKRYDSTVIKEHIKFLFEEGFISGSNVSDSSSRGFELNDVNITLAGIEFLEANKRRAIIKNTLLWLIPVLGILVGILKAFGVM